MTDRTSLRIDTILPNLKAGSRKQAFRMIAGYAARVMRLDGETLFDTLIAQERKEGADSGIGSGVAVIHLATEAAERPYILFARAVSPIPYGAADNEPVDLVFLMLSPEEDGVSHLQRLSRLSRMVRDKKLCQRLRGAETSEALYAILHDAETLGLRSAA